MKKIEDIYQEGYADGLRAGREEDAIRTARTLVSAMVKRYCDAIDSNNSKLRALHPTRNDYDILAGVNYAVETLMRVCDEKLGTKYYDQ
jgi:hypothetical protein